MWQKLRHLFTPPVFEDEDKTRIAKLLSAVVVTLFLVAVVRTVLTIALIPPYLTTIVQANGALAAVLAIVFTLLRTGRVIAACILLTLFQWLSIALLTYRYGGVNLSAYGFFIFVILAAGLFLGGKWALSYASASVLYGLLLLYLEYLGFISPVNESPLNAFNTITPSFITTAVLVYLYSREITRAIAQARGKTAQLTSINQQLTHEISERARIEKKLLQAQKMEAIGTLAGGIAHDFNNILSSIIGYTELALDEMAPNTVAAENIREVHTAGLRAKDLVNQILTFARQSDDEIKPIQVSIIVNEVLKLLRSSLPATIEIKKNITSNSLVLGNPGRIYQILMNLCTNAAQAMEEDGGIMGVELTDVFLDEAITGTYQGLKTGDYLKLTVSDTASGISPEIIQSIFEPYFTTKAPGKGTGMGLATVHGIVKNYGGEITVESEVEKGSTFTVYLPVSKKLTQTSSPRVEALPLGSERILVVDDEPPIANVIGQILEKLGYRVTILTSSLEALKLFRSKPTDFDLVITDLTMPNMTGDKLAAELIAVKPDIAVIICTGYGKMTSEKTLNDIGVKAISYKPVTKSDLAGIVRKALDAAANSMKE